MTNATNDIKCPIVEILKSEKGTLDKINNFRLCKKKKKKEEEEKENLTILINCRCRNDFFWVPWWLLLMHERDKCDKMVNFRDIRNWKERFVSIQTVLDCTKKINTHHFDQLPLPNNFFLVPWWFFDAWMRRIR